MKFWIYINFEINFLNLGQNCKSKCLGIHASYICRSAILASIFIAVQMFRKHDGTVYMEVRQIFLENQLIFHNYFLVIEAASDVHYGPPGSCPAIVVGKSGVNR